MLKQLRLAEERGTGIPAVFGAMAENGSPAPRYEFDEQRTYFTVTLPAHPEHVALSALRESTFLSASGNREAALKRLEAAYQLLKSTAD
jgi:ATP-dependent DNA helicase RecG